MKSTINKIVASSVVFALIFQLAGCGTILHPERKGQVSGQIDPKIAIFDALGLLFFFIPGVIAFAVDFSNGTIYLPGGRRASLTPEEMQHLKGEDNQVDKTELIGLLQQKGLLDKGITANEVQMKKLDSVAQVEDYLSVSGLQLASRQ
jgi:hypothetical protein